MRPKENLQFLFNGLVKESNIFIADAAMLLLM